MVDYGPNWNHDPETDVWYFYLSEYGDACRTETLGARIVNIDYDHSGNVVGVEIL